MLNQFKTSIQNALEDSPVWKTLRKKWETDDCPVQAVGFRGFWGAFLVSELASVRKGSVLVVLPDEITAAEFHSDLQFFLEDSVLFPWWGSMLYRGISPQAAIFGKRASILADLLSGKRSLVVASLRAALGFLPSPSYTEKRLIRVKKGASINPSEIAVRLEGFGYNRVPRVTVPGEFALRGEVLDVGVSGKENALRVVYVWDEVEEIRYFDPVTQQSVGNTDEAVLYPLREINWDEESLSNLKKNLKEDASEKERFVKVQEAAENGLRWRGEELFYPLGAQGQFTLSDYLGEESALILLGNQRLQGAEQIMIKEHQILFERATEENMEVPPPHKLTGNLESLRKTQRSLLVQDFHNKTEGETFLDLQNRPGRSYAGNIDYMQKDFQELTGEGYQIFIFAESEPQADRIRYLLGEQENVFVGEGSLSAGFELPHARILAVHEKEIFGRRKNKVQESLKRTSAAIDTFLDLSPGDIVVHVNHGIGRFKRIKRIHAGKLERDYIELEYAGEETLFVPIEQVNLVQRYIGRGESSSPRLDRIGGSAWERKKSSVKRKADDLAVELVKLYARRLSSTGFAFPSDDDFQISFEAEFPYRETPDQLSAVADVKKDMETPRPMDRLICGDVGYGKTEIAMRAAFKAVMGGRQVAYLCPTTILAEQIYENFNERFKRFPVTNAMLSRLVSPAESKGIIRNLQEGRIDIVVGTHRLLSADVAFKNLGLIVIDEEQRFGVKDKERFKELKASVDCLTLSATPIPRTLHMSLSRIRDMTLLKTAPINRRPIETFIQEFEPELIARAIRREVERGGQVFYLHNRVRDLEEIRSFLHKLVPEVFVEIAHGQMAPRQLEETMYRFVHGAFSVLLATSIIENGLDIPNVNTIIIDRADMYGISQLYQFRGRVGRSARLAYAYLFYPAGHVISELAVKRLQAISDFRELGSGFKIAMKDLEVRGAGNLLGHQQSGEVSAVGFDLYLKLLDQAIRERTEEESEEISEPFLELEYSGYIPDSYIDDESEKMLVYKKIAGIETEEDLQNVFNDIHDRFGPLPDEVHSLAGMAEIRIICRKLRVVSLKERSGTVCITFGKVSILSVDKVMRLIRDSLGRVKMDPSKPESLLLETGDVGLREKSLFIRKQLASLL